MMDQPHTRPASSCPPSSTTARCANCTSRPPTSATDPIIGRGQPPNGKSPSLSTPHKALAEVGERLTAQTEARWNSDPSFQRSQRSPAKPDQALSHWRLSRGGKKRLANARPPEGSYFGLRPPGFSTLPPGRAFLTVAAFIAL